jgi:hypothetical protein
VVLATSDRDSQVIGRAAADILQTGFAIASVVNVTQARVLIVGSHAGRFGALPLAQVHPAQTVFAMELHWQQGRSVVPDVAGIVTQASTLPWAIPGDVPADDPFIPARDEEIVRRIIAARDTIEPAFSEVIGLYRDWASDLKGRHSGQRRLAFRRDSPVPAAVL